MTLTAEDLVKLKAKAQRRSELGSLVDVLPGVLLELIRGYRLEAGIGMEIAK